MGNFILQLYVTGQSVNSQQAIANLRDICSRFSSDKYELVIIDVLEEPQVAEREKIFATPTLIRRIPPPARRVVGDLSDPERVVRSLNLKQLQLNEEVKDERKHE